MDGYEEITKMLTSLVQDNETLKHDNGELQQLLNDSREDFATLQGDFEEYKANPPVFRSGGKSPRLLCSGSPVESVYQPTLHTRDISPKRALLRSHPETTPYACCLGLHTLISHTP